MVASFGGCVANPKDTGWYVDSVRVRYFCPVVDDATCFAVIGFLKKKSDTPKFFSKYAKIMELQRESSIKAVRSDNGGEFTGNPFKEFCSEKGIVQEFTTSYSPWRV